MISPSFASPTGGEGFSGRPLTRLNAVLRAVNSDVYIGSYEELASGVPVLLHKVFESLFNYSIMGINSCPSTLAAHERNCDIVLNELRRNMDSPKLLGITGAMICNADNDAISRLIDALFEHTNCNNGWFGEADMVAPPKAILPSHRALKKDSAKKQQSQYDLQSPFKDGRSYSDRNLLASGSIESEDLLHAEHAAPPKFNDTISSVGDFDAPRSDGAFRTSKSPNRLNGSSNLSGSVHHEYDTSEIASGFRSEDANSQNEAHRSIQRKKHKRKKKRSPLKKFERVSDSEGAAEDIREGEGEENENKSGGPRIDSSDVQDHSISRNPSLESPRKLNIEESERKQSNLVSKGKYTKRRPISAPSRRLMSALHAAIFDSSEAQNSSHDVGHENISPRIIGVSEQRQKSTAEKDQESLYTYDLKSGRKVLKSDIIGPTGRYESIGIVKDIDALHADHSKLSKKKAASDVPPEPTVPAWPSYSTEQSVLTYIKKNKMMRDGPEKPPPPPARTLPAYFKMEPMDLVISVEHCCNCEHHNTTLRHDSKHYVEEADAILKTIAQGVHEANLCVRLGVFRFEADVTPKSRESDTNSRIGAFEVQVCYKNQSGDLVSDLIHSKLHSRNWPSRTVILKRLTAFLAKTNIERHRERKPSDQYEIDTYGTNDLPRGIGPWLQLSIARPMWTFVDRNAEAPKPIPPMRSKGSRSRAQTAAWNSADAVASISEPAVEWVFDTKGAANESIFEVGESVWVSKIKGERYPLKCVVAETGLRSKSNERALMVHLIYDDNAFVVPETQCLEDYKYPFESGPDIPRELCALLIHAFNEKVLKWSRDDPSDDVIYVGGAMSYKLCRKSLFHNLRALTVAIEGLKFIDCNSQRAEIMGKRLSTQFIAQYGTHKVSDPVVSGNELDLQLSYSEVALDWAIETFGPRVDTSELVDFALSKLPKPKVIESGPTIGNSIMKSPESKPKDNSRTTIIKPPPQVPSEIKNNIASDADDSAGMKSSSKLDPGIIKSSVESFASTLISWCDDNVNEGRSEHRFEPIEKMFEKSNGKAMDIVDFNQALQKFGVECSIDVASSLLATFDTDGKGELQYDKLVSFLQDKSSDRFALGGLWLKIRRVLVYEEGDRRVHLLGDLEERILHLSSSLCERDSTISYGLMTESDLYEALNEFGVYPQVLTQEEVNILKCQFSVCLNDVNYINGASLCAWLQPVNVERAARRIAKSLESYVSKSSDGLGIDSVISRAVDKICKDDKVSSEKFLEALRSFGIAVSRAEFRAFARHFNGPTGSFLSATQSAAILHGEISPKAEIKEASSEYSPVLVESKASAAIDGGASPDADRKVHENIEVRSSVENRNPATEADFSEAYDDEDYDRSDFEASSPTQRIQSAEVKSNDELPNISGGKEDTVTREPEPEHGLSEPNNADSSESSDSDKDEEEGDIAPLPELSDEEYALRLDIVEIVGAELKKPDYKKVIARIGIEKSSIQTLPSNTSQIGTEKRILDMSSDSNTLEVKPASRYIVVSLFDDASGKPFHANPGRYALATLLRETKAATGGSIVGVVKFTVKIELSGGMVISVNITGHFVEAKSSVSRRIRKMSMQDLAQVVFEPLNFDEDSDEEADLRNRSRAEAYRRPSTLSAAFLES